MFVLKNRKKIQRKNFPKAVCSIDEKNNNFANISIESFLNMKLNHLNPM
jgi:hypothetical protein